MAEPTNAIEWLRAEVIREQAWELMTAHAFHKLLDEAAAKFPQPTVPLEQVLACVDNEVRKHDCYMPSHRASIRHFVEGLNPAITALYAAPASEAVPPADEGAMAEVEELRKEVDALEAKCRSLSPHRTCCCSLDDEEDMCLHHSPKLVAATARIAELERQLGEARAKLEQIVCTKGIDKGVVYLSQDGPTQWDSEAGCRVYKHEHFSPLGDALIELHGLLATPTQTEGA